MINLTDSFVLAKTKFRTHKVRLILSILTSSVMFSAILFGIIFYQGAVADTIKIFSDTGLSGRSILSVNKLVKSDLIYQKIVKGDIRYQQITQMLNQKLDQAEKIAKQIDFPFDRQAYRNQINPFKEDKKVYYIDSSDNNVIIQQFFDQQAAEYEANQGQKLELLTQNVKKHQAKLHTGYKLYNQNQIIDFDLKTDSYQYQLDNEDKLDQEVEKNIPLDEKTKQILQPTFNNFTVLPEKLNKSFLIKHNWKPENNTIPVILPLNLVERLLKIEPLKNNTDKETLIEHSKKIVKKAENFKFKQCVYNQKASHNLRLALSYQAAQKQDQANKNKANYYNLTDDFELIYQLPDAKSCAVPQLITDRRSNDAKQLAAKRELFNSKVSDNIIEPAKATKIQFELVGILPINHSDTGQKTSLATAILDLIIAKPNIRAVIPEQLFQQMPNQNQLIEKLNDYQANYFKDSHQKLTSFHQSIGDNLVEQLVFVELKNGQAAQKFSQKFSCELGYFDQNQNIINQNCPDYKSFRFSSFANNQIEIYQFTNFLWNVVKVFGLIVAGIAVLITFGVISRLLADNRKETAVFRAIGFRRIDISLIYISYTLMICSLIIISSTVIALSIGWIVNTLHQDDFTIQALYLFNSNNFDIKASFIGWNWPIIGLIYSLIVASGLVSLIIPLLLSIKRNPINDMRSE